MSLDGLLQRVWYGHAWKSFPLRPLSWPFAAVVALRRRAYAWGLLKSHRSPVPVIVVGNLTVGGTGKTPVAAWLARELGLRGHRVGVVLRGYGGQLKGAVQVVTAADDPAVVGDEALLHARRGAHVVVVGADRVAAARRAAEEGADVVVCDDGLQHLRLARDCEIAVLDGQRQLGNRAMLPVGPLREAAARLESVDAVVVTDRVGLGYVPPPVHDPLLVRARLILGDAVNLVSGERRSLERFAGQHVDAVGGVGNPGAFFAALRRAGLEPCEHALPDHAALDPVALPFDAGATVLMTEKDAVKCRHFAHAEWWYVELDVAVERDEAEMLIALVRERAGLPGLGVLGG